MQENVTLVEDLTSVTSENPNDNDRIQETIVRRMQEISSADLCVFLPSSLQLAYAIEWIPPTLHEMFLHHFARPGLQHSSPLILERPGNVYTYEYLHYLPDAIVHCFVLPVTGTNRSTYLTGDNTRLFGLVVVAYYQAIPLREEVLPLLQVLTAQAASVLENMQLVGQVIEARTEASKLLKWALDDHRLRVSILESISSGVILLDMQGDVTTYNASARAILGYTEKNVIGQTIDHILPLRFLPLIESNQPSVLTEGDTIRHEVIQAHHSDGHPLVLDTSSVVLRTNRGRQIGVLVTFSDVTSLHRLEEEKRRLDRLASLGQMSANIAHEVRNPLASIKMSLQILLRESDELLTATNLQENVLEMKESMSIALQEVDRLNNLVDELLFFAKPKQIHRAPVDIRTLLDRVLFLLQKQVETQGVIVECSYQDVPLVSIDAAQIEQVLLNIYTNALQAMPRGGTLSISISMVTIGEECVASPSLQLALPLPATGDFQHPLKYLELVVRDTGCGIAADQIAQIGQPFFTTKAHGMGLGMAISKRLIEEHRGRLDIQSKVDEGTILTLYLPVEEEV